MLKLYSLFHLNLLYSSIEVVERPAVVARCYWPLLKLAHAGVPIAVEASGMTLQLIQNADGEFVAELKRLIKVGKIDFVGSGYTQLIGPLVPWQVNVWNQHHGMALYEQMLEARPKIALVNEMAYSAGLVRHYLEAGYAALVMDWNNPRKYHPEWPHEQQYRLAKVETRDGNLKLIWSNFVSFQKFQRVVHEELSDTAYLSWLMSHRSADERLFSLYSGDVEVFDYRPGRYATEAPPNVGSEWKNIDAVYQKLQQEDGIQLIRLSDVLQEQGDVATAPLQLESPAQPIPVKKQEKYNIIRWALTGRDDQKINTACYRYFHSIKDSDDVEQQRNACYLWSSDFRTHITDARWREYSNQIKKAEGLHHGRARIEISLENGGREVLAHPVELPYVTSTLTVIQKGNDLVVKSPALLLRLNLRRGLAISELRFLNVCDAPLLGTLPHGYYEDISFAADFYTGHTVIERPAEHKQTDLAPCLPTVSLSSDAVDFYFENNMDGFTSQKRICVSLTDSTVILDNRLHLPKRSAALIRPMHVTFFPESFNRKKLFYATHNGGQAFEKYALQQSEVHHSEPVSPLISAKHGLGATEGLVVVGDDRVQVRCEHDNTVGYVIPAIKYTPVDGDRFFLRLQYSAQELDETFRESDMPQKIHTRYRLSAAKEKK
ncbi:MAG: glycoside hydrolase family 57 [Deltaproteobacteria bacterium]|nr:glycoside hydrolase family 57 [Deltaproteobacteria bacterium]